MVWLKRLSVLIGGLLVLVSLLIASVVLFVNPNDFKDELKAVALEKANVNLRLDGDIQWSFYPWLGLELEDIGVALGSDMEIVQFDRAEFGLAIKPLLQQRIEVNKVNLVNLKASLSKDENGQGNWQLELPDSNTETAQTTSEEQTASSTSSAESGATEAADVVIPEIQLDELRIENAQLQYRDEQTNQLVNATLNVQINDVQWDTAWPMVMDVALTQSDLQGNDPIKANLQLNANLSVFPEREAFSVDALALSAKVESGLLPASPLEAKLNAIRVDFDLPQENVLVEGMTLSALGVNLDAKLEAYQVLSDPQFTAIFSLGEFNPREVIAALNIELPDMSDDTAFTSAQMNMSVEGSLDSLVVKPLSLQLDDTRMEANAAVGLSPLYWDLRIAGANLDLDRYLPEPVEGESEEAVNTEQAIESEASDLIPVELIRQLNGHVGFAFDNLTVKKLKIDRIELDSTQSNGIVKVAPLQASLYEGSVSTSTTLNVQGSTPTITLVPSIDAIQIQPLLVDFMDMDKVAGATYLNGDLMMKGNRIDDLMASLQGDLLVEIKDGALIGTNLTKSVCEGIASVRKDALDSSKFGEDTPFEVMTFPAHIVDGQVSTPGSTIRSAGIEVTGDGVISLTESSLDYQTNVGFPGSALDDACQVNEKVAELTFPVICRGQFSDDPAGLCRPDLKGFGDLFLNLASAELKAKAEEEQAKLEAELKAKLAEEQARLKAELEAKKEAEEEALKEKLKNKLKDLF